jgi:hypothetical protein
MHLFVYVRIPQLLEKLGGVVVARGESERETEGES